MIGPEARREGGRRWLWPVAGACLAMSAFFGAAAAWEYRLPLGTWAIQGLLERQGLGPVKLAIDRVDWSGLHARTVELLAGALTVDELSLAFSPDELVRAHLGELQATGAHLTLAHAKEGGAAFDPAAAAAAFSSVRIDRIRLVDARLSLPIPGGAREAVLSGEFALTGNALHSTSMTLDTKVPIAGAEHPLKLAASKLTIGPEAGGGLSLAVAGLAVVPTGMPWRADGIDGEIVWRADRTSVSISAGALVNDQKPALLAPLHLTGTATLVEGHVDFASRIDAQAVGNPQAIGSQGKARMEVKGRYELAPDSGSAVMTLGPIEFHRGGMQPSAFFPQLGHDFAELEGRIALAGSIGWRKGRMLPHLILSLDDVAFDTAGARVSRVHGTVDFVELWPPATSPNQKLTAEIEASGLPASQLTADFQLRNAKLLLDRIELGLAGGRISTAPFVIDPAKDEIDAVLRLDQIDLAELMKLINVDGLGGSGRIDGHIPISRRDGHLRLGESRLAASGPGILRYKTDKLPKELTGAGPEVELALRALEDFHYESLSLELSETETGEGAILLAIHGSNPAVLEGRIFNFNIRLESNFDRLTDLALRSMESAQELLRRAEGSLKQ